jgi:hypothetical protein
MREYHLCVLLAVLSTPVQAKGDGIPANVLGRYERVHEVRDYCRETVGACPSVKVRDSVVVAKRDKSSVSVVVSTYGNDLHVCNFEGVGQWSSPIIKVRSAFPDDSCQLVISFAALETLKITGVANNSCEMNCGANASIYVEGLRKVAPK